MNARSKDEIRDIILKDLLLIHNRRAELSKRLGESLEENLSYVRELSNQLSQPSSGPLVPKTPKILRKKAVQRIETILEDEVFQQENFISPASSIQSINEEERKESEVTSGRTKRGASKRAADNIKKQSSIQPENEAAKKAKRESQVKRKKTTISSSDEDERVSKYSKVEKNPTEVRESTRRMTRKKSKQIARSIAPVEETREIERTKEDNNFKSPVLRRSSRASSKSSQNREVNKADDVIVVPNADDVEEPSMYEDAIGKPIPIMNSTLKHSPFTSEKVLNATVVLERLPQQAKLNETVVIQKALSMQNGKKSKERKSIKKTLQDNTQLYKASVQYNDCNGLITDDESSPEIKKQKKQLGRKQGNKKQTKDTLLTSSEDEIPNTPVKTRLRDAIVPTVAQESKATYKSNALFSPYAKESVKKRVEAFEQAVMHSPKPVDVDAPTRITRTKTRAMANAEPETETKNADKNVAHILARKSLAKAKKISLAKHKKENDEFKEVKNKEQLPERINKLLMSQTDKRNMKQIQQLKVTPLSKIRMMQSSMSVNRLHTPSNVQNLSNYPKVLTASRANIVASVDSFIQPPKSHQEKTNSVEKLEEKRRHDEDARKKREEALRLQTEEKRRKRQEKELKNKLAREAKEKQEMEKRQKTEREKEEKARLALLMQEKQREELEKRRLALQQRAQEKEERRKLEEQQRLQRLQEQEETERLLAEQRRREQEAEKRKEAEARAQQAAAEALKQKNQILAAQAKYKQQANNKHQGTVNYVLDSEPDDDESDDESRPKHEVPHWAQPHVRKPQLAMQQYIPEAVVYKFFNTRKCTPDLTDLFQGIDRNRLKRTSSAIWKTPPRFSMMEAAFVEPKLS